MEQGNEFHGDREETGGEILIGQATEREATKPSRKRLVCPCGAAAEVKGWCRPCYTVNNREKRRRQMGTQPHAYQVGVERICLHCQEKPPGQHSRLGLCADCTQADKLAKASVTAEVIGNLRGPKIVIQKFKNKTGYKKRQGFRADLTRVKITGIK